MPERSAPAGLRPALALYQPDIAQNAGTLARAAACLDVCLHIIEPAGFPVGDAGFRRAGMDYLDRAAIHRHASFTAFEDWRRAERRCLVLCSTGGAIPYTAYAFRPGDILMLGRESAGVPDDVHSTADARIVIPMMPGARSLNVALAGAMILGEALRQTGG
ncbi:tRNA (cytidine(34)-2'-O)-methyltransferase [Ancylobacter sp. 6x-1]|uniref:tRNA (cytidine(34)-2'-O)-methyltransferase n=1 Tax=Ancylobacter crimeensis TaxID=2579147 RepID=A0ABT0D9M6_9HYPH|nr:tRNA (cytidine(34)-2'-O)-methyltransferase [Ancylobacter crimeensis]MCK0196664.1 tRNA (cytidine(34)-2'-O)-methyltransferase [Ancylobacter crimeensis]